MSHTINNYVRAAFAVAIGIAISDPQQALAGWTGQMNGLGVGRTSVNVISSAGAGSTAPDASARAQR